MSLKIVFFGNASKRYAGIRYRVLRFSQMLRSEGHRCVVCLPASVHVERLLWLNRSRFRKVLYLLLVLARRIGQLRHVIGADAVVLRGPVFDYGPPVFERLIRFLNPRLVYDIDDAVWEPPAYVDSPFVKLVDRNWIWKMCRICACGIVGNEHLKCHVRQRNPSVAVIPTCIDAESHVPKQHRSKPSGSPVVIGWVGVHTNLGYFEVIADVLRELSRKHDVVLSIASSASKPFVLDGVEVVYRRWELANEFEYLSEPDIGVMPLTWSRRAQGKCAFKALQFMGVGTPCVISPVGMNAQIVEDGVTGFLADSPQEWHQKLERLIVDSDLRERMGRAARQFVMDHYTHEAHYPVLKQVLKSVAGRSG